MERRNLIAGAALAAMLGVVGTATAALTWRTVADGPAPGRTQPAAKGYIALGRASALAQFGNRLSAAARTTLGRVDFAHDALVAVFGDYGCNDANVVTAGIVRHGATLTVKLVPRPPAPGTANCEALFPTYRFLALPRSELSRPLPTRVVAEFA